MFKYSTNTKGIIQVVIGSEDKKELESMGFVDHVDKVKLPVKPKATKNA